MRPIPVTLFLFPFLFAAACGGPPPVFGESRRLSKDERPTVWDSPTRERLGVADMRPAKVEQTRYVGVTPAGWVEKESQPQRFRDLVWGITGAADAECWLTASVGGGVTSNLGRWYGQFGLPASSGDSLPEVPFAGGPSRLLELSGSYGGKPGITMMVVFTSSGQKVTSLKLVGPIEVVKANRDEFLALAASLHQETVTVGGAGQSAGGQNGGGRMPQDEQHQGMNPSGELVAEPFLATVPASWQRMAESQKPLHHTFGTDGEVYVSQLSGDVQPMLGIWRGEVGLPDPMTAEEFAALPTCEMLGAGAIWMDASGDYTSMSGKRIPNARIIVVVRNDGGTITFAKLVGRASEVMAEAEAFRAFCASIRRNS